MPAKLRILSFAFFIVITTFLSGCFLKQTPEQRIYDILEKVVTLEEPFVEQQDSINKIEQQEKVIYDEIIDLGMKEQEKIIKLADEALSLVEKRIEHAEIERDSIVASEKEFQKILPLIEKIEDSSAKKEAENLYETMINRYKIHKSLHEHYINGAKFDSELFSLLKEKDVTLTQLEEQVEKINNEYKQVIENNKKFNEQTDKFNEVKFSFYKKAGFDLEA